MSTWSEANGGSYRSPYRPRDTWMHVRPANASGSYGLPEFDFEVVTNSLGLRDVEHPVQKAPGELRVVGLGDSFTEGQGAPFEKTWLQLLAVRLRDSPDARGRRITPIVGGVSGSDPFYAAILLEEHLLAYRPDLVLLAINKSDLQDVMARGGRERFRPDGSVRPQSPAPRLEWAFSRSHLVRAVLVSLGYDFLLLSRRQAAARETHARAAILELVVELHELGLREDYSLLVILHPSKPPFTPPGTGVAALAEPLEKRGVPVLDLIAYFRSRLGDADPEGRFFWPRDRHLKAEGYALFAEGVAEAILARGLLPQEASP